VARPCKRPLPMLTPFSSEQQSWKLLVKIRIQVGNILLPHDPKFQLYHQVKNGVFWDITPCGSCKNRRFGGT
jgi:hypothetical protein